jgi:hypothetical protein
MAARSLGGQAAVWWERRLSYSGSTEWKGSSLKGSCLQGSELRGFRLKLSEPWGFRLEGWELQGDVANASPGRSQLSKLVLSLPVRSKRDR